MEVSRRLLGDDHPDTLSSRADLASTYSMQGRWKDAEELGLQVTKAMRRLLGNNHPATLISTANLASARHSRGEQRYSGRNSTSPRSVDRISLLSQRRDATPADRGRFRRKGGSSASSPDGGKEVPVANGFSVGTFHPWGRRPGFPQVSARAPARPSSPPCTRSFAIRTPNSAASPRNWCRVPRVWW